MENKRKEFESDKFEAHKKIQETYTKKRQELEKACIARFLKLASGLSEIKQVEVGIAIAKGECTNSLGNLINKSKVPKTKFANFLAKGLEDIGNSYAALLLTENPNIFSSYNVRKFKEMMVNIGPDEVISTIPQISEKLRKEIKKKYERYHQ